MGQPQPQPLPPVPVPAENPITDAKRVLGKMLFWDEQLSSDNTMACGTCHIPSAGGGDPVRARQAGPDGILPSPDDVFGSFGVMRMDADETYLPSDLFGFGVQITDRAANSNLMAMYSSELFWDGRAPSEFIDPETGSVSIAAGGALESQAVGPVLSDVEMAHSERDWAQVSAKLTTVRPLALATDVPADMAAVMTPGVMYPDLFEDAFGSSEITAERIGFAIATYQRTLLPDQTAWDAFVDGDPTAMTPQQVAGWNFFRGSACAACHQPPTFTDQTFRNIGLPSPDIGREAVTGNPADRGRFKVPSLRNVGLKSSFMHNGSLTTMPQVFQRYGAPPPPPGAPNNNRDPLLPVPVPPNIGPQVADFILNALTDPRVENETFPFDRPTLRSELPANPSIIGLGTVGSGGQVPQLIAVVPPNVGNDGFKIGVFNALGGAQATVLLSSTPPIAGVLQSPDETFGPFALDGVGAGEGFGTFAWPIPANAELDGQTVFMQWEIADGGAPGGTARSAVGEITMFCNGDCPPSTCLCEMTGDAAGTAGFITVEDLLAYLSSWFVQAEGSDITGDGMTTIEDLLEFLACWLSAGETACSDV